MYTVLPSTRAATYDSLLGNRAHPNSRAAKRPPIANTYPGVGAHNLGLLAASGHACEAFENGTTKPTDPTHRRSLLNHGLPANPKPR